MKRIIFLILLGLSTLAISVPQASARVRHHRRYHTRVITRTRYISTPAHREHGLNGNVGVGLGPLHVGANAGVGIHVKQPPPDLLNYNGDTSPATTSTIGIAATAAVPVVLTESVVEPDPFMHDTLSPIILAPTAHQRLTKESLGLTNRPVVENDYYFHYVPPPVATVEGYSVPVSGDPLYYSFFKHRHGMAMPIHNDKGIDSTAMYGASPRAQNYPESIGNSSFSSVPRGQ